MSINKSPRWNNEILAHIFALNTHTPPEWDLNRHFEPFEDRFAYLDAVRLASQVCHSWRMVLLRLPSVWGNLIDLDRLTRGSVNWSEEVLRRTGESSLSIFGNVNEESKSLFASLLENQWHRVRRIDIDCTENILNDIAWDVLWTRPAPILETLIVPLYKSAGVPVHSQQLFQGFAPSLRNIHFPFSRPFDLSAPWLSQLRSLTLPYMKTIDALTILSHCSSLEELFINSTEATFAASTWTQPIHLPLLSSLSLEGSTVIEAPLYLANIVPGPNCVLYLETNPTDECVDMDPEICQHLADLVVPYAENYFRIRRPIRLRIHLSSNAIAIRQIGMDKEHPSMTCTCRHQYICFHLEAGATSTVEVSEIILGTLLERNFDNVLHLNLKIDDNTWLQPESVFLRVLLTMTSIQTVSATPRALQVLNRVPGPSPTFPKLTYLSIYIISRATELDEDHLERDFTEFLSRYNSDEYQHITLDITKCFEYMAAERWKFLDKFKDLKLICDDWKYTCGHGEPWTPVV